MSSHFALRGAFAAGSLLLLSVAPAVAQDAQTVMKKVSDTYTSAKTYQADYVANIMSPKGAMTMTISMKRTADKARMSMTTAGAQVPAGLGDMMMVDDGKTQYTYVGMMKAYTKGPHNPKTVQSSGFDFPSIIAKQAKSVKMLPSATIKGKSAYAIEMISPKTDDGNAIIYIEKATYHVLQIKSSGGTKGNATVDVKNEVFNANIPASAFVFTPPPGSKPMDQAMGGLGGAKPRK